LAPSLLKPTTRGFIQLNPWSHSPYITSSLTTRWVFLSWICLVSRELYVSDVYCEFWIYLIWIALIKDSYEAVDIYGIIDNFGTLKM
jgi:hypothetical protein